MKIQNGEIKAFSEFLLSLELKGKQSRMRTRFIRILEQQLRMVSVEYKLLVQEYAHLDENKEPKTIMLNDVEVFDMKDLPSFQAEYEELMKEEFVILRDESNEEMLQAIAQMVLDCDSTFSGEQALQYDRFCDIVESDTLKN